MTLICAEGLNHKELNDAKRNTQGICMIDACCGQRFIAAGMSGRDIEIQGIPGNALGAYLNGGTLTVLANAQDAVGDTMNEGKICNSRKHR
jgi:glutamate synthase domain-containing protein 3